MDQERLDFSAAPGELTQFVDGVSCGFPSFAGFRMAVDKAAISDELPHTQVTVLFQLGDPVSVGRANDATNARALIVGLAEGPTPTRSEGLLDCVELRLSPIAAFRFLGGMPMTEIAGRPTDLSSVFGNRLEAAIEQAVLAPTWKQRFEIVFDACESLPTVRSAAPEVREAWTTLVKTGGTASVRELCAPTGWSANRLRTRFEAQIGLTPKRAARLIRFERAHKMLAGGMSPIDTAVACGFADQSHLHREVQSFATMTPAQLAVRAA
jgi:AraC-like DNA-binding protein